jgi:hypothetical protein
MYSIRPEYSAVGGRPCARSIRVIAPTLDADRAGDIGCGFMAGTMELLKHHGVVFAVDREANRSRLQDQIAIAARHPAFGGFLSFEELARKRLRLDAAYVVNVLHTLPSAEERLTLLSAVHRNVRRAGTLVLDVPSYEHYYAQRMTSKNAHGDGYVFEHPGAIFTFYRFTSDQELDEWAGAVGFRFERRVSDNHHHVRVYSRR